MREETRIKNDKATERKEKRKAESHQLQKHLQGAWSLW